MTDDVNILQQFSILYISFILAAHTGKLNENTMMGNKSNNICNFHKSKFVQQMIEIDTILDNNSKSA